MKVDINKTYRTKSGLPVVIYAIYEGQKHAVHGAYQTKEGKWIPSGWTISGHQYGPTTTSGLDLVEVRPEIVLWVNEYAGGELDRFRETKEEADKCHGGGRIALHRVVLNEDTVWQADAEREGDDE